MSEHIGVLLEQVATKHSARIATRIQRGGAWQVQTYEEFSTRVRSVAQGLLSGGIRPGDRVGLFAANTPEWSEADFGALTARAVPVPLYATSTPEQIRHIMADSGARIMFVGGRSEAERLLQTLEDLPELQTVVAFESWEGMPETVTAYEDFLQPPNDAEIAAALSEADGTDLASIIYTSGTTGPPKGVMLTHRALVAQKEAVEAMFPITPEDHSLAFLPLSHALERGWTTVVLLNGCMNTYVADPRTVAEQMPAARPTMMASVPKLYETVFAGAHSKAAASPIKRAIFTWALGVGRERVETEAAGRALGPWKRILHSLADKMVLTSIRDAIGGPKNVLACGGAPIRAEVEEFFLAVGQPIYTGYGLTEASPLVSFNSPSGLKVGSAGRVMQGSELRISDDGEVLYRGPNVMAGYWNDPEASAQVLVDGWLHTGDIGHLDEEGFLFITDRIKDIIVTLGGKNVAPQPIESLLLADPLFEHAVILGDNRPFLTLLVKPSLPQVSELGKALKWPGELTDWLRSSELLEEIRKRVRERTALLPSQDQPKEAAIMDEEPTMDNDLLTPTLKIKRRQVEQRFAAVIEEMYTRLERLRKSR